MRSHNCWPADRVDALLQVEKALSTKGATRKSSELTNEILTPRLRSAITEELDRFGLTHLKLKYSSKGRRGSTTLDVSLDAARARTAVGVLSEGECRGLALAIFLAEARVADQPGGLVLDDPVSSLDDPRRQHIADRLCELAKGRQVVVFTHDPVFVAELERSSEHAKCGIRGALIERWGDEPGIVHADRVWLLACVDFAKKLRVRLDELQRMESEHRFDRRDATAHEIDCYLRYAWERAVEERLLNGTVQRYRRQVNVGNFDKVCREPTIIAMVAKGLDEVAFRLHDQGAARPRTGAPTAELRRRVEDFERFLEASKRPRAERAVRST
jgi:hypothetical protein